MNDLFKLAVADAFADKLRDAAAVDPVFAYAQKRWGTAKAHVAKGHEQEKERLQNKGELIGSSVSGPVAALLARRMGMAPAAAVTAASMFAGAMAGNVVGGWEAERRLQLSQLRGRHGHYAPGPGRRKHANVNKALSKIKIPKPPTHKPKVVATPAPSMPRIEPSTVTPSQPSLMPKTAAGEAVRRRRRRVGHDSSVLAPRKTPENEPVLHEGAGGGPRDF